MVIIILLYLFTGIGADFHKKTKLTPLGLLGSVFKVEKAPEFKTYPKAEKIKLPAPDYQGIALESAIKKRRSVRDYSNKPLKLFEISQLLWSAQGITGKYFDVGLRSVPSAGALYPYEVYLIVENVENLKKGIYHYNFQEHSLELLKEGSYKNRIFKAALLQEMFLSAPVTFVYSAVFKRTTSKYDERGYRYVYIEAGHIGQNVSLQAVSLGLASCVVGAFLDDEINKVIGVDGKEEAVIYLHTIGRP